MTPQTTYVQFEDAGRSDSGKTIIWAVRSKAALVFLGHVKWYAPWRRYCFYTQVDKVLDAACLTEIATFLAEQTARQKGL